jgi:hypothetical protein
MSAFNHHLPTQVYLEEIKTRFPYDLRLEIYRHILIAVDKIDPIWFLTITFASKVSDEIACEGICRRITTQLERTVIGKRTSSKLPCFVVLERVKGTSYHVHVLIGRVQGETRSLSSTTFKHYIQKKPFSALIRILNRLTYPTNKAEIGRIGICDIQSVHSKQGAIDYMLKALKPNQLNVAWLASNIDFLDSTVSVRPLRPKRPI